MFSCIRSNTEVDEVVRKRSTFVDNLSLRLLRRWHLFSQLKDEELLEIKSFHVFSTAPQMSCRAGLAAIFLTANDEVFGLGHNCSNINILGFSRDSKGYKTENVTKPLTIGELSFKGLKDLSIGGLVGGAITGRGTLLMWGVCSRRNDEFKTPHIPRNGKRRYIKVACGLRMVAALSESRKVYVWGQVGTCYSWYQEGEPIVSNAVISDISCGLHHIAMMNMNGRVFTWGRGNEGQRSLDGYSYNQQYDLKKMNVDPCVKIRCGPFSTFCLTIYRELKACGSNGNRYLGTNDRSNQVKTLSKISTREDFSDLVVLWRPDNTAQMAASTTGGNIYTWGNSPNPSSSDNQSFFEFFTKWEATPGMTSVCFPDPICSTHISGGPILTPREIKSVNVVDVLTYIYLRDHPEQPPINRQSPRLNTRDISYLSSQITCEKSGKAFIMERFFKDIYSHSQDEPPEYQTENSSNCLPFTLCSSSSYQPR